VNEGGTLTSSQSNERYGASAGRVGQAEEASPEAAVLFGCRATPVSGDLTELVYVEVEMADPGINMLGDGSQRNPPHPVTFPAYPTTFHGIVDQGPFQRALHGGASFERLAPLLGASGYGGLSFQLSGVGVDDSPVGRR